MTCRCQCRRDEYTPPLLMLIVMVAWLVAMSIDRDSAGEAIERGRDRVILRQVHRSCLPAEAP